MSQLATQPQPDTDVSGALMERVILLNDLRPLSAQERVQYYRSVCQSLGLNWLTRPFSYLDLQGRVQLYANRDAADQLRRVNGVSVTKLERELMGDVYAVVAYATDITGRTDSSIGAVPVAGLKGEALANAYMKCETKAKRRVTLSICGLGIIDESEVGSIPGARIIADPDAFERGEDPEPLPASVAQEEPGDWRAVVAEPWAKLQRQAHALHLVVPPIDIAWSQEEVSKRYNDYRELVRQARADIDQLAASETDRLSDATSPGGLPEQQ